MDYELVDVRQPEDWAAFHAIRRVELFEAKGRFGVYNDAHPDDYADFARPFLLKHRGQALGTARLDLFDAKTAAVRLVAITAAAQGRGHGRVMEQMIADRARSFGMQILLVNAADTALGFYEKTGWHRFDWDPEEVANSAVACIQMRKLL